LPATEDTPLAHEQRRLAAIVAIDVVGYSRLMGRNESGIHALLKAHFGERVMPSLTRHGGRVVKSTGDGVIAEFGSTIGALSALIELQQEMASANRDQLEADRMITSPRWTPAASGFAHRWANKVRNGDAHARCGSVSDEPLDVADVLNRAGTDTAAHDFMGFDPSRRLTLVVAIHLH
jgi:hypothetical protein